MIPETVHDKDSFIEFLGAMRSELGAGSEDWVNVDLDSFLEGDGCLGERLAFSCSQQSMAACGAIVAVSVGL